MRKTKWAAPKLLIKQAPQRTGRMHGAVSFQNSHKTQAKRVQLGFKSIMFRLKKVYIILASIAVPSKFAATTTKLLKRLRSLIYLCLLIVMSPSSRAAAKMQSSAFRRLIAVGRDWRRNATYKWQIHYIALFHGKTQIYWILTFSSMKWTNSSSLANDTLLISTSRPSAPTIAMRGAPLT